MSAPAEESSPRVVPLRPRVFVPLAIAGCVAVFLWAVAHFFDPKTGFTSLISIGDILNGSKVTALRQMPHHVYEDSAGYDGAYYAQLALHPTLDNPELQKAIDNLPYRARRILFCWTAWLLGLGQPAWVLQAHALLNVLCWFGLGALLLRWFPPDSWGNFLRWFGVMFSHGVCMSVRHSLVDGPSLLLVALALTALEKGRVKTGGVVLALAGLGKETSLLAAAGIAEPPWRSWRNIVRHAVAALLIALPLLAWMGYVRWKFGPADDPGLGNFTLPLVGLAEKYAAALAMFGREEDPWLSWGTLASVIALTLQMLFFLVRWQPADRWWRVGVVFAIMMLFLGTPVWEGFPGAFTRVLLPMSLAFNIVVPRDRRWLPLLIAGNLSVISTYREYSPPAAEFFRVEVQPGVAGTIHIAPGKGWYGPEEGEGHRWRWASGESTVRIQNGSNAPVALRIHGRLAAPDERRIRVLAGEALVWSGQAVIKATEFRFGFTAPPGETMVRFTSEKPPRNVGTDPRKLSFNVSNMEIVVGPVKGSR